MVGFYSGFKQEAFLLEGAIRRMMKPRRCQRAVIVVAGLWAAFSATKTAGAAREDRESLQMVSWVSRNISPRFSLVAEESCMGAVFQEKGVRYYCVIDFT